MGNEYSIEHCPIGHCSGGPCAELGHGVHKAKHVVEAIHEALGAPPMSLDRLKAACDIVDIAHETARADGRMGGEQALRGLSLIANGLKELYEKACRDRTALLAALRRIQDANDYDLPYAIGASRAVTEKIR